MVRICLRLRVPLKYSMNQSFRFSELLLTFLDCFFLSLTRSLSAIRNPFQLIWPRVSIAIESVDVQFKRTHRKAITSTACFLLHSISGDFLNSHVDSMTIKSLAMIVRSDCNFVLFSVCERTAKCRTQKITNRSKCYTMFNTRNAELACSVFFFSSPSLCVNRMCHFIGFKCRKNNEALTKSKQRVEMLHWARDRV